MSESTEVIEALSLLTPYDVPAIKKVRIGNKTRDGGYVLADHFRPGQKVYSYGISDEISFDLDMAKRGLQIFMYDHTIAGLPFEHPNFHFSRQGLSPKDEPAASLFSLIHHIEVNGHGDQDMILKMDIEGAEWDVLDQLDPDLLARFEQITMEIHGLERLGSPGYRDRFARVFRKLNSMFHIIHVHANSTLPITHVCGLPVPMLLEVTWLRKDLGTALPWSCFIPSALDAPNILRPDHVLAFFPFLPTNLPPEDFKNGLIEAHRRACAAIETTGANIAMDGTCRQSSLSKWSRGPDEANNAVRSSRTGRFAFHTDFEEGPWWQIDLGAPRKFDEVICYNRLDNCSDRARNLILEVSADQASWAILHANAEMFGGIDGAPLRVVRQGTVARYVRLRAPTKTALHLDGVEIYDWSGDGGKRRWSALLAA